MAVKTFVLDTNVLLHSAQSIEKFQDNNIVIPMAVVEELDKFKKNSDELGRNARQVIRRLDILRKSGKPGQLREGVPLSVVSSVATGKIRVLTAAEFRKDKIDASLAEVFRGDLGGDSPDNRILQVAYCLNEREDEPPVVFVSKDINLRLKADALGLKAEDYENGKVNDRAMYTGFSEGQLSAAELDALYKTHEVPLGKRNLLINEFMIFSAAENPKQAALTRLHSDTKLKLVDPNRTNRVWNVSPRNREQRMALDLLLDPEVQLVTLTGGAGTGKTLLALAAALQLVQTENVFDRILVSRPIIPLGNDIGYLPGDKGAKLQSWMQPIFDNLDFLLGEDKEARKQRNGSASSTARATTDSLIRQGKLDLEALTYIRGRSIPRQFVIVDEAQNLTPHEVKTIVSRCGEDTKMVLTGDPHQIDNPYLDASSNGLSYIVDRLKGQNLFGHITLAKSERSPLAALAATKL